MSLTVTDLACGYGKKTIVSGIDFTVEPGDILCILGPNGIGKTTLFRTIQGFLPPHQGQITLDERNLTDLTKPELARLLAYVPQTHIGGCSFPVREMVVMGRTAHLHLFQMPSKEDYRICDEIMAKLHISHLAEKLYSQISGGERQMALIARALVQQPQILMMDEPTSNLDFGNQIQVLQKIIDLSREGLAVVMTTHVPDQAFMCATKVALFRRDRSFLCGPPQEIVTPENLQAAYGIPVKMVSVEDAPGHRTQSCVPILERPSVTQPLNQRQ